MGLADSLLPQKYQVDSSAYINNLKALSLVGHGCQPQCDRNSILTIKSFASEILTVTKQKESNRKNVPGNEERFRSREKILARGLGMFLSLLIFSNK